MCLRAIKTKHYSCSAYLSSVSWAITLTYTLNRLSSFQNLRRNGGKFDHRPERPEWPKVHATGQTHTQTDRQTTLHVSHLTLCIVMYTNEMHTLWFGVITMLFTFNTE